MSWADRRRKNGATGADYHASGRIGQEEARHQGGSVWDGAGPKQSVAFYFDFYIVFYTTPIHKHASCQE
jgi:hypothetical protein